MLVRPGALIARFDRQSRPPLAWAALAMGVTAAATATAQSTPSLNLRQFEAPADPGGGVYLESTQTPSAGDWNVGVWASYAYRSVVLRDAESRAVATPLEHQLSVDYLAAVSLIDRLAVSITVPTVVAQSGDDVTQQIRGAEALPKTALGDVALGAKATIVPLREMGGFGLAVMARVTFPSGNARSYLGEGAISETLRALAEYRILGLAVRATAGARVRGGERTYVGERFGHDLPWGVGLSLRPKMFQVDQKDRWEFHAEARGALAITPHFASGSQSPALLAVAARYRFGDFSTLLGAEFPGSSAVGVPSVRGLASVGWAPRSHDMDGDGIADDVDRCPELAEDRDGFEDGDGCLDFDNDGDGVGDTEDKCPHALEDLDDHLDTDGCPDLDNDADGVPDQEDACADQAGPKEHQGCPLKDSDQDGIQDSDDRCPIQAEDRDGYSDEDGCPDPDNDGDGIPDASDGCPDTAGTPRSDPLTHGCPSPDRDRDTFDDAVDACPEGPEDFQGISDDDGCPDQPAAAPAGGVVAGGRLPPPNRYALVSVTAAGGKTQLSLRSPPSWTGQGTSVAVDPKTFPTVRALAQLLNANPSWIVMVGVRPENPTNEAQLRALAKSFVLVSALRRFTHRDSVAESVGWAAVAREPGAATNGLGLLVITQSELASELKSEP